VQGFSPSGRRNARHYVGILAVAHIASATVFVALLSRMGEMIQLRVPSSWVPFILLPAALLGAAIDVRAIRRGSFSVGLRRQTPKALAHLSRLWWVTPLLWGLDTGLIWTTFRVSFCSWILLLLVLLGVAPAWSGLVYGLCFAIPLVVTVHVPEHSDGDSCRVPSRVWIAPHHAQLAGVAASIVFAASITRMAYG